MRRRSVARSTTAAWRACGSTPRTCSSWSTGTARTTGRSSAALREHGIPPATEAWFDARATEDELLTGVYLKVRPRELLDELQPRPGQRVVAVEEGEALFFLGERQMRIVRSGEVVRVPPELPHRIEDIGDPPLRLDWPTEDPGMSLGIAPP